MSVKDDIKHMKTDVATLKTDVSELKIDMSSLKTDVDQLKVDVGHLKTDVSQLKIDGVEIRQDITVMKDDIRHNGVQIEELHNRFDFLVDVVVEMRDHMKHLVGREEFTAVKANVHDSKIAVKETNGRLDSREVRLTRLETAA